MFDGIKVGGRYDSRDTSFLTFYTETPAHAPGIVDLVVTNPDGQSHGLAGGYTYAPQESFDLNGAWGGYSLNGTDTWVEFVIQDNRLVSASCAYDVRTPFTLRISRPSRTASSHLLRTAERRSRDGSSRRPRSWAPSASRRAPLRP